MMQIGSVPGTQRGHPRRDSLSTIVAPAEAAAGTERSQTPQPASVPAPVPMALPMLDELTQHLTLRARKSLASSAPPAAALFAAGALPSDAAADTPPLGPASATPSRRESKALPPPLPPQFFVKPAPAPEPEPAAPEPPSVSVSSETAVAPDSLATPEPVARSSASESEIPDEEADTSCRNPAPELAEDIFAD
jgi:hypothetical protein